MKKARIPSANKPPSISLVTVSCLFVALSAILAEAGTAFDKPGFTTVEDDGRLWVLKPGQEIQEKHVSLVGAGPLGMTVKAIDRATALEYIAMKPGFEIELEEGRIWVLRPGQHKQEKHVILVGAGPLGTTIKSPDRTTALEYLASKQGYDIIVEEGRLWVLRPGQQKEARHVTLVGAGPLGLTIKALDRETALEYLAAKAGFDVKIADGQVWVFLAGESGEIPAEHVTRVGAGPNEMTVVSPDIETLAKYLTAR